MASSGNFCTYSPRNVQGPAGPGTYSATKGNLGGTTTSGSTSWVGTNFGLPSGKWYWEARSTGATSGWPRVGFYSMGAGGDSISSLTTEDSNNLSSLRIVHNSGCGVGPFGSTSVTEITGSVSSGDIVQIAIDVDAGKIWYGVNNTYLASGNPTTGANAIDDYTAATYNPVMPCVGTYSSQALPDLNFGQDSTFGGVLSAGGNADGNGFGDFKYAPPTGFLALCSANLSVSDDIDPAQTEDDYPAKNFNVVPYTGNQTDGRAVTGVGFAPDLVWIKQRVSFTNPNILTDTVRGATKRIESNVDIAEATDSDGLQSFTSDGFTLGTNDKYNWTSSHTYVAWCWKGGGAPTATNSAGAGATPTSGSVKIDGSNLGSALAGSIPATKLSANTKGGFSIITYTGTGSNATIAHGLSAKPDFILTKRLNSSQTWGVYHTSLGATKYLALNTTAVAGTASAFWNDTEPTTSVISLGTEGRVNGNSQNYVAYAWHNVEGYQKFGSYIGNNTDNNGPFVYTGFRPRMLVIKGATEAYSWFVFDSARNTYNLVDKHLRWDGNDAEATEPTGARKVDFLSNGFKVMADAASINGSGDTYVYMAWGDVPFKYNNTF